jgi:hypothetical protein
MARSRSAAVTTIGILNIIFGSLGLLLGLCGVASLVLIYSMPPMSPGPGQPPVNLGRDIAEYMEKEIPGHSIISSVELAITFVMSVVLLVVGIGMLKRQGWARVAGIIYAGVNIVQLIVDVLYKVILEMPAMNRWAADFQRRFPAVAAGGSQAASQSVGQVVGVLFVVLEICYAVVLLVILFLPHVRAEFSGRRPFDDDYDDYDDRRSRRGSDDYDAPRGYRDDDDRGYFTRKRDD